MMPVFPHRPARSGSWRAAVLISSAFIFVFVLMWILLPVAPLQETSRVRAEPFISMQRSGDEADTARDQALLLDSAPLFLPTRWSTAVSSRRQALSGKMDLFRPFSEEITIDASVLRPKSRQTASSANPDKVPLDCSILRLVGMRNVSPAQEPARSGVAFYEVLNSDGSKVIGSGHLAGTLDVADDVLWQPVEFWIRVVQEGMLGNPLLSSGSGIESLDSSLRDLVVSSGILTLLSPGYYKVIVGP